ncbi:MAG: MFS transporter [Burkholderiales bacterium]
MTEGTKALDKPGTKLVRSKLFWVAVLYFSSGFPLGVFYEMFPVYFRQAGVDLRAIGVISLLGLAWTLKFLWAPAIDHYRSHRVWMAVANLVMGVVMIAFAYAAGVPSWVWLAIGVFTLMSATNDIAIDGYTIEYLAQDEIGLANGIRIGFARVGMLASGGLLILTKYVGWAGAFWGAVGLFVLCTLASLAAPRERRVVQVVTSSFGAELRGVIRDPRAMATLVGIVLATLWMIDNALKWSLGNAAFWPIAIGSGLAVWLVVKFTHRETTAQRERGPMFGTMIDMLNRPYMVPVLAFVLIFKLGDASMGFMVKPFWVDSGFTAAEIGLVSVNIGLILSIAGGLAGGWYVDRVGTYKALWVLGLLQAASNLGYWFAAGTIPLDKTGAMLTDAHRVILYLSSATESFTGGLGTAAFLAFLMSIVDKRASATEYALLSSVFALSRSVAGWASGFGATEMGYANYFLLTFFLSFPAYFLLPWVKRVLTDAAARSTNPEPAR